MRRRAPRKLAITAWSFSIYNLAASTTPSRFTVGHVVGGLALICTSLIALVWSILRQVQNTYGERDRIVWPLLVIVTGSVSMIWGIVVLALDRESYYLTPGFVMIGLGLVCFSILSKVGLLALVWRRTFALANRVPLVPDSHGTRVSLPVGLRVPSSSGRLKRIHPCTGTRRTRSDLLLALFHCQHPRERHLVQRVTGWRLDARPRDQAPP